MADKNYTKEEMLQKKQLIRSEIVSVFTKFINRELSSEEEWQLTNLYIQDKYLKDGAELSDEKNSLKWLSLGWYINEFLLK